MWVTPPISIFVYLIIAALDLNETIYIKLLYSALCFFYRNFMKRDRDILLFILFYYLSGKRT